MPHSLEETKFTIGVERHQFDVGANYQIERRGVTLSPGNTRSERMTSERFKRQKRLTEFTDGC